MKTQFSTSGPKKHVYKYKIVLVGDQAVGKSSVITRYIKNQFDIAHNPTIGIDFLSKTITLDNNKNIRLQLWDTAGQERFRSLIPGYLKDSNAALIVFDITNTQSFQSVPKWIDFIREVRGNEAQIYLIGNKMDLIKQRNVTTQQVKQSLKGQEIKYYEVSAKTGTNIIDMFKEIGMTLFKWSESENGNDSDKKMLTINDPVNSNKRLCC